MTLIFFQEYSHSGAFYSGTQIQTCSFLPVVGKLLHHKRYQQVFKAKHEHQTMTMTGGQGQERHVGTGRNRKYNTGNSMEDEP